MLTRGGSRIFSRGGRIFKKFSKILTTFFFFLGRPNWFFELSQSPYFAPILAKFSAPQANFWKNSQKAVFGNFLKNFDKKIAFFFGARSPSKLVYIGAEGAFRKILGSVRQKWISEKVSKGGPFGSAGGRIPEGGGVRPPPTRPPPKSAPDADTIWKTLMPWVQKSAIVFIAIQNKWCKLCY